MKKVLLFFTACTFVSCITYFVVHNNDKNIKPHISKDNFKSKKKDFIPNKTILTSSPSNSSSNLDFNYAAEKTINSVVHIKSEYIQSYNSDPLLDYFWGPHGSRGSRPQIATGSGVIISEDGYIITNNHVIDDASNIFVTLNDGRELSAEIIGTDPNTDLALLKTDEKDLPFTEFGDSDDVKLGDWVLAVGNPFNLTSTVTAGIVSAKSRNINILRSNSKENIFPLESFIQTDAAVNPGNSGGALVTPNGYLIGINTAIASKTGSYSGYSFAIPSNIALKVVNDLKNYGMVQRAFIGVIIQDVTQELMNQLKLPNTKGVLVSGFSENGAAEDAGIEKYDIILQVEGTPVNDVPELQEQIGKYKPGDEVNVLIQRNNELIELRVKLRNRNGNTEIINKKILEKETILFGASLEDLLPNELKKLNIKSGVRLKKIDSGIFKNIGIENNFIITHIDKSPVENKLNLISILNSKKGGILIEGLYPSGVKGYYGLGL